jgi:hypothetical protein
MDPSTANQLGRIEGKLDQIVDRITEQGQEIARHDVRIQHVESHVEKLQAAEVVEQRQGVSFRATLTVAAVTVLSSGGISFLVNVFNR